MRSASTGTPAACSSISSDRGAKRRGFTLLEALVALALVSAFFATLAPFLFHARKIMDNAERRVAANILLRTLLNAPFDRFHLANTVRAGTFNGLHWRIAAMPFAVDAAPSDAAQSWTAYRIVASVSAGPGLIMTAETIRLGKPE
jgi:prepilin-type N-terminal cleavage/methylation domain-containing protein